jgi:hypothetical protein
MTEEKSKSRKLDEAREEWLAIRKQAGLEIDPENAEVTWIYAMAVDPYGIYGELPEALQQVGREYFARAPGNEVWVLFADLPKTIREALWQRHRSTLAFPAGLSCFDLDAKARRFRECQFHLGTEQETDLQDGLEFTPRERPIQ